MSKKIIGVDIGSYSFDASNGQITISGVNPLQLENLLLITNVTDGVILYNFADSTLNATMSSNIITLTTNTSGMSNTDDIQIYIEDGQYPITQISDSSENIVNPMTNEKADELIDAINNLCCSFQSLKTAQGVPDVLGRIRANVETGTVSLTGTLPAGTNSLGNIGTLSNVGAQSATYIAWTFMNVEHGTRVRNFIDVT